MQGINTNAAQAVMDLFTANDAPMVEPERAMTVRVPLSLAFYIEALRDEADVSKQYMLQRLLELGVGSLMAAMPKDLSDSIEGEVLSQLNSIED